ncbi:hypothetical protein, partial [Escherichia coli]|uniref:hypothetical protein n=1 Tax=Escherichia coli TaxID=562 RepID=UPI003CE71A04
MSHTGRMPEVKNRMFTLHPLFTTYHSEIKGENQRVNSVCVFRSIRSRIGIEVRSAIRIHSINR